MFPFLARDMADFKTHVSFSTAAGVVYGTGIWLLDVPAPTSAIAGGICAISGMFPDIDSKTSRALQETLYLIAGLVCMLVLLRLREFELNGDLVLFIGAAVFLLTKLIVGEIVVHTTSHRGMVHSIPAALIAGSLVYLLASGPCGFRTLKALGLVIGYMSHLLLDEIYSVDVRGVRMKKSFGTALKFTCTGKPTKNAFVYALLVGIGCLIACEETLSKKFTGETERWTSEGIKALERYSQSTYSDAEYQWFMMASMFGPDGSQTGDSAKEELFEEETSSFAKPSFSREPISRNAYSNSTPAPIRPYQSSEQSTVPSPSPNAVLLRNSVFKSTPHSPTGL
ncbi:MAG: metal-dependent hydrolase [Planctomycetaceae bacterium]|nr:metal-dependent hydrolase [Planctomycetaceae bacterium]